MYNLTMYNVQLMYNGNNVQLIVPKILNGQIVNKL